MFIDVIQPTAVNEEANLIVMADENKLAQVSAYICKLIYLLILLILILSFFNLNYSKRSHDDKCCFTMYNNSYGSFYEYTYSVIDL